jgi:hypothetical protein
MNHAHLLASGVCHAFDSDRHGQRATGVEMLGLRRQQAAGEWVSAFDSVLRTMGWLHDEDLAVMTWLMGNWKATALKSMPPYYVWVDGHVMTVRGQKR